MSTRIINPVKPVVLILLSVALSSPALGGTRIYQERYCAGMETEHRFPDGTHVDCISDTHAIEVDFSDAWAEAIGQALHYALWTADELSRMEPRKAGIVLVCRRERDTCTDHVARIRRIVQTYNLPLTVWDCDRTDLTLAACQMLIDN